MATTKTATKKVPTKSTPTKPTTPGTTNDKKAKIDKLLKQLETATIRSEKQAIRRQLRSLGHRGGLGRKKAASKKK